MEVHLFVGRVQGEGKEEVRGVRRGEGNSGG